MHKIEFLALLAFVARERQRLRTSSNPHTRFTRSDLEMAYAFRQQFGTQRGPSGNPIYGRAGVHGGVDHQDYSKLQQRASQLMSKSPTDSAIEAMANPQGSKYKAPMSLRDTAPHQPNPLLSSSMQGDRLSTSFRQSSREPFSKIQSYI